jgi:hypothetical protein
MGFLPLPPTVDLVVVVVGAETGVVEGVGGLVEEMLVVLVVR